jgi:phosphatidylinositol alpha-mannosyltransferase
MKIAQLCPYDIDRPGGVQAHIRDTAVALENLGHSVTIVAPRAAASPEVALTSGKGPVEILRIGTTRKIGLGGTRYELSIAKGLERRRLKIVMREGAFDLVHYHTPWTPILPFQAMRAARCAAVATFHDTTSPDLSGAMLRFGFRLVSRALLPRLDAAIAVSTSPLENFRGPHAGRIEIVPPCTNLHRFLRTTPRAPTDDRLTILFIGRLEERKGARLLLEAYRRLCADGLPLRLIIAGKGEQEAFLRGYVQ